MIVPLYSTGEPSRRVSVVNDQYAVPVAGSAATTRPLPVWVKDGIDGFGVGTTEPSQPATTTWLRESTSVAAGARTTTGSFVLNSAVTDSPFGAPAVAGAKLFITFPLTKNTRERP